MLPNCIGAYLNEILVTQPDKNRKKSNTETLQPQRQQQETYLENLQWTESHSKNEPLTFAVVLKRYHIQTVKSRCCKHRKVCNRLVKLFGQSRAQTSLLSHYRLLPWSWKAARRHPACFLSDITESEKLIYFSLNMYHVALTHFPLFVHHLTHLRSIL